MADKEVASFSSEAGGRIIVLADTDTGMITGFVTPGGKAPLGGSGTYARTAAQLAAAPSASDLALGAAAQFYDVAQVVDATHPWVYYSATATAYVKVSSSDTTLKMSALGTWNLTTNVATAPDGKTTFTPASGVYPASGANILQCIGTGSQVLDGETYGAGDYATMNPALGKWVRSPNTGATISATTAMKKGDGAGNAVDATPGVDYAAPPAVQCKVAVGIAPSGTFGANGAWTSGTAMVGPSGSAGFYSEGIWLYFAANAITGSNAAGFYWTVFSSQTAAIVYNTVYTPGTQTGAGSWHIPASPTPFSGTTGSANTGVLTTVTAHQFAIPANSMGPNGELFTEVTQRNSTTAGQNKLVQQTWAGNAFGYSGSAATLSFTKNFCCIENVGRTDRQVAHPVGYQSTASISSEASADTTAAVTTTLRLSMAAATEYVIVQAVTFNVRYGA